MSWSLHDRTLFNVILFSDMIVRKFFGDFGESKNMYARCRKLVVYTYSWPPPRFYSSVFNEKYFLLLVSCNIHQLDCVHSLKYCCHHFNFAFNIGFNELMQFRTSPFFFPLKNCLGILRFYTCGGLQICKKITIIIVFNLNPLPSTSIIRFLFFIYTHTNISCTNTYHWCIALRPDVLLVNFYLLCKWEIF